MKHKPAISLCLLAVLASGCLVEGYENTLTSEREAERSAHRDRLFRDNPELGDGTDVCERWTSLDPSRRAVFLSLTDRMHKSMTPDGLTMLKHIDRVHLVIGGGDSGDECGGPENNRLFMSMDVYLWERMVRSQIGPGSITDGGGSVWQETQDLAGPHEPFTASNETNSGLRCTGVLEMPMSRPPTAQAQFFLEGDAARVERGPGISLEEDPYMLEVDHDFDCFHESNPLCPEADFEQRYVDQYGEFGCDWVPHGCMPIGDECYPEAE